MGGATIGSGGYKCPPLSKVYPPPGGYRGYKLVARGGYKLTYFGVNFDYIEYRVGFTVMDAT